MFDPGWAWSGVRYDTLRGHHGTWHDSETAFFPVKSPLSSKAKWEDSSRKTDLCLLPFCIENSQIALKHKYLQVTLKHITSNAEKIPGPKTPSQIISWPKHKNCSQQLKEQTKPYKRFRNLPAASPAPPWFPCHQDYVNNSGHISWARTARGCSSSIGCWKQPSRNGWKQQKLILSKEKSLCCWAALSAQPLPTKGWDVGVHSSALTYRKAEVHLKDTPGCRKYQLRQEQTGINRQ